MCRKGGPARATGCGGGVNVFFHHSKPVAVERTIMHGTTRNTFNIYCDAAPLGNDALYPTPPYVPWTGPRARDETRCTPWSGRRASLNRVIVRRGGCDGTGRPRRKNSGKPLPPGDLYVGKASGRLSEPCGIRRLRRALRRKKNPFENFPP